MFACAAELAEWQSNIYWFMWNSCVEESTTSLHKVRLKLIVPFIQPKLGTCITSKLLLQWEASICHGISPQIQIANVNGSFLIISNNVAQTLPHPIFFFLELPSNIPKTGQRDTCVPRIEFYGPFFVKTCEGNLLCFCCCLLKYAHRPIFAEVVTQMVIRLA